MDIQLIVIAVLAVSAIALAAIAIVREVRNRKMDANVSKMMERN